MQEKELSLDELNAMLAKEESHVKRDEKIWKGKQEEIKDIDVEIKRSKIQWYSGGPFHDSESYYVDRERRRYNDSI